MKKINRIQVGTGNYTVGLHRMTKEEMMAILGGTGCCFDTLADLYNTVYGANVTASQFKQNFANFMSSCEKEYGDSAHLDESGDPTLAQSNYLLAYINGQFTSTTSWKNSGGSYNFGIIKGNDSDGHAVVIQGGKQYDFNTQSYYYNVHDVSNDSWYTVSDGAVLGMAPVSALKEG